MKRTYKLIISTFDAQRILGVNDRAARRVLSKIREKYGKDPTHCVTWEEFSESMGIPVEDIQEFFRINGQ